MVLGIPNPMYGRGSLSKAIIVCSLRLEYRHRNHGRGIKCWKLNETIRII